TTTFRSGTFSTDSTGDIFNEEWTTEFYQGNIVSGDINSQNKVQFVNTPAPAALLLQKELTNTPDDFDESFTFQIELQNENGNSFVSVPWFSSVPPQSDTLPKEGENDPTAIKFYEQAEPLKANNGVFTVSLKADQAVILYGLPLNTKYTITEVGIEGESNYSSSVQNISVVGDETATKGINKVVGVLSTLPNTPPVNASTINTSVSVFYTNILSQLNQLRVRKLLRPAPDLTLDNTDEDYEFNFQITLTDENGQPIELTTVPYKVLTPTNSPEGTISLTNGIGRFQLTHLQEIEIYDLPENTSWEIQELNGDTPLELYQEIDNKYLLTWKENEEGNLASQTEVPEALFVNLKFDPNGNGGLKILAGNRPEALQEGEFQFVLKGISASTNGTVLKPSNSQDSLEEDNKDDTDLSEGENDSDKEDPNKPEDENNPDSDDKDSQNTNNSEEEEDPDQSEEENNKPNSSEEDDPNLTPSEEEEPDVLEPEPQDLK
ncbi:MAG: hypothetical protein K2H85_05975, partial [Allobaculum sp.]|nr:hypothetical protein [Allobaculum sp.]